MNNIINLQKNCVFVGRGATAIYLILKSLFKNKEVIMPSNICYAAIYPVIYSENYPIFVDINPKTGNATYEEILKKVTDKTAAIIFPYMYGNVSYDILKLKKYCQKNKIILIEDCASAMGATVDGHDVGTIGDYAIFSTGHAKIIDVGNGGLLLTNQNVDKINDLYNKLPLYNEKIENRIMLFSKDYRKLRNQKNDEKLKEFFHYNYEDLFLYKIDSLTINKIKNEIQNLEKELRLRNRKYNLYLKYLKPSNLYEILCFEKGSTPWRFTILLKNQSQRQKLIDILLSKNLFVSDWYPNTGKFFDNGFYPFSDSMADKILNFSLTESDNNIIKICKEINNYFKE